MSKTKTGFTLIELSLSIVFIAILSISVVLIIVNAVSSYRRGLTLNQVNTVGMDLVDDIRASVQNSPGRSVIGECAMVLTDGTSVSNCEKDGALRFVYVEKSAKVSGISDDVPVYGAFCPGSYSYIWRSGYYFNEDGSDTDGGVVSLKYKETGKSNSPVKTVKVSKLLKVHDPSRAICIAATTATKGTETKPYNKNLDIGGVFDVTSTATIDEDPVEILSGNNLAIYDFNVDMPAESSTKKNMFYPISFILGTVQGGINIMSAGNFCDTPAGVDAAGSAFDYCAINKFNFAAQANGG